MLLKYSNLTGIKNNKPFLLFLVSQIISCFGNAFHFIAITALLIKITGFGASAGFIVICTPISSLLFSPLAGGLGDRFDEKYFLALINLLKALVVLTFLLSRNIKVIYILMLVLASLDVIDNPAEKKIITRLLSSKDIIIGNSILMGITGFAFIIGPVVCGIIIELCGPGIIFIINSVLYFSSAVILLLIKNKKAIFNGVKTQVGSSNNIFDDIKEGVKYFRHRASVKKIIFINTVTSLLIASVNAAFYSFAFDILGISSGTWGIMMSLFYGTNLVSMFVSIYFNVSIQKMGLLFIYMTLAIVSGVWLCYSLSIGLFFVFLLQFVEGLLLTLVTIFLNTKLQLVTGSEFLGRVVGINDILNNVGKLVSVGVTYIILQHYSAGFVFVLNCICLFLYTVAMVGSDFRNRNKLFQ